MNTGKRNKRRTEAAILALAMTLAAGKPGIAEYMPVKPVQKAAAAETKTGTVQVSGGNAFLTADKYSDHVVITGAQRVRTNGAPGVIVEIPDEIDGLPVTEIADNVFVCDYDDYYMNHYVLLSALPSGLKVIGKNAFNGAIIHNFELPEGIEVIGEHAFDSSRIENLNIPASLKEIGDGAFAGCSLTGITVSPDSKYFTMEDKFLMNSDKTEIICSLYDKRKTPWKIPSGVKKIRACAFPKSDFKKAVELPEGIEEIGDYAFSQVEISSINLPASLKKAGICCLGYNISEIVIDENNSNFTLEDGLLYSNTDKRVAASVLNSCPSKLVIREGTESIDDFSCAYHAGLSSVTLPESLKKIGANAFTCSNFSDINLPEGLEYIGSRAFVSTDISEINMPDTVTFLGDSAFENCEKLKKIKLSENLEAVYASSFAQTALAEITVPDSVKYLDNNAFSGCKIKKITLTLDLFKSIRTNYNTEYIIRDADIVEDGPVFYTADMKTLIKFRQEFSENNFVIPETVKTIDDYAFSDCYYVTKVVLPEGLKKIGTGAFRSCGLTEITVPESVENVGNDAFLFCDELLSAEFKGNNTEIGTGVFKNCFKLCSVRLPEELEEIPENTFANTYKLNHLILPISLRTADNLPEAAETLIIGKNTETNPDVFAGLNNLKYIAGTPGSSAQKAAEAADIAFIPEYRRFSADSSRDGRINILDMIYLRNYILNDGNTGNVILADTNLDGTVNVKDIIALRDVLLGTDKPEKGLRDIRTEKFSLDFSVPDEHIRIDDEEDIESFTQIFALEDSSRYNDIVGTIKSYLEDGFAVFAVSAFRYERINNVLTVNPSEINSLEINAVLHRGLEIPYDAKPEYSDIFLTAIPKDMYSYQKLNLTYDMPESAVVEKPIIYLYPEEETEVNVKLTFTPDSELAYSYPQYPGGDGWTVTANPDSVIHDENGREYSYLFWEADSCRVWDMSEGFVVRGSDTVSFLQEKLEYLGLTPKEYNEFIVYWMPQMQNNKYNLIKFQTADYEKMARLDITPEPDSIQRVFMTFKALDEYTEVPEQHLEPFSRHGFSVIEWGGTEVK